MSSEQSGGDVRVECPRCPAPVAEVGDGQWSCPEHGVVAPLWRPAAASYDAFAAHLQRLVAFPTYLPWPLGPGWTVSDFAAVATKGGEARATMTCVSGASQLDGPVDVMVVSEEPGTGFGARVAGLAGDGTGRLDPGHEVGEGPAPVRVRVDQRPVGLWPVSVSAMPGEWDRSVLAGEAGGRWLWLVLRPASAILLLRDDWILRDVSATGPGLVALPFGGAAPPW
ncbi:hypothetical protein L615_000500000550 [Nocardioides sp. J9]|uniref:DUF6758 family protein n=1 Tax=unclassified Nocardioides TaxID=2615069 RepID=UPI00068773C2|nr:MULTISPECIES: DUF6758 family protein [unclassified Nocardioides]TWG95111.1 hypothetical protein L615_000500000550 [Nocardioides sp. J9]